MAESHTIFWTTNSDDDLILMSHLLQTLQKNYSVEPKFCMTKPRKMSCSRTSNIRGNTTKKAKASPLKEKEYCCILQPKADHQGSKIPFRELRWIGPYLVENVLPKNKYIVTKLNTNKTQILHRIRLRKHNPEKPPEDNYQEAQWQIDDNNIIPQDDLYTLAWEVEFGGHLFDFPIIYTDPNAIDFDESYTHDQILLVSHVPIFMIQAMVKIGKLAPLLTHL